jgi:hypothetical protein
LLECFVRTPRHNRVTSRCLGRGIKTSLRPRCVLHFGTLATHGVWCSADEISKSKFIIRNLMLLPASSPGFKRVIATEVRSAPRDTCTSLRLVQCRWAILVQLSYFLLQNRARSSGVPSSMSMYLAQETRDANLFGGHIPSTSPPNRCFFYLGDAFLAWVF